MTPSELKKIFKKRNVDFREYKRNLHMGLVCAKLAENYTVIADDLLRQASMFKLTYKQDFNKLTRLQEKILKSVDNLPERHDDGFFNTTDFGKKVFDILSNKILSKEDEIKILSYLKLIKGD